MEIDLQSAIGLALVVATFFGPAFAELMNAKDGGSTVMISVSNTVVVNSCWYGQTPGSAAKGRSEPYQHARLAAAAEQGSRMPVRAPRSGAQRP